MEAAKAKLGADEKNEDITLEPIGDTIKIDDFDKCDIRVAKVISCEKVPKSKKLLKFILNDGFGERQVVSGIAKFYTPEELVGKKILVIANLAPATLAGVESQGMIISAVAKGADGEEKLNLIMVDDNIPCGSKLC